MSGGYQGYQSSGYAEGYQNNLTADNVDEDEREIREEARLLGNPQPPGAQPPFRSSPQPESAEDRYAIPPAYPPQQYPTQQYPPQQFTPQQPLQQFPTPTQLPQQFPPQQQRPQQQQQRPRQPPVPIPPNQGMVAFPETEYDPWRTYLAGLFGWEEIVPRQLTPTAPLDGAADPMERDRQIIDYNDRRKTGAWNSRLKTHVDEENRNLNRFIDGTNGSFFEADRLLRSLLFQEEKVIKLNEEEDSDALIFCKYASVPLLAKRFHCNVYIAITTHRVIVFGADHEEFGSTRILRDVKDVTFDEFDKAQVRLRQETQIEAQKARVNTSMFFSVPVHSVRNALLDFTTVSLSGVTSELYFRFQFSTLVSILGLVLLIISAVQVAVLGIVFGALFFLLGIAWLLIILLLRPPKIPKTDELDTLVKKLYWLFPNLHFNYTLWGGLIFVIFVASLLQALGSDTLITTLLPLLGVLSGGILIFAFLAFFQWLATIASKYVQQFYQALFFCFKPASSSIDNSLEAIKDIEAFQTFNEDIDSYGREIDGIQFTNVRLRRRFIIVKYQRTNCKNIKFVESPDTEAAFTNETIPTTMRAWKISTASRDVDIFTDLLLLNIHESVPDTKAYQFATKLLELSSRQNQFSPYPMPTIV